MGFPWTVDVLFMKPIYDLLRWSAQTDLPMSAAMRRDALSTKACFPVCPPPTAKKAYLTSGIDVLNIVERSVT